MRRSVFIAVAALLALAACQNHTESSHKNVVAQAVTTTTTEAPTTTSSTSTSVVRTAATVHTATTAAKPTKPTNACRNLWLSINDLHISVGESQDKAKNEGFYPMSAQDAQAAGFYRPTGSTWQINNGRIEPSDNPYDQLVISNGSHPVVVEIIHTGTNTYCY